MQLPTYQELSTTLEPVALKSRVSEWHGFLCGVLAVDISYPLATSVQTLVADAEQISCSEDLNNRLEDIYKIVKNQMTDSNLQFELCLPNDDSINLNDRVLALASWCDGFLFGLANAGLQDTSELSSDVQEILRDFSQIAQLAGASTGDEEEEMSYIEIIEFVRIAVLLVAEEVQPITPSEGIH